MASDPTALLQTLLGTLGQGYNGMQQVQQDQQVHQANAQALQAGQMKIAAAQQAQEKAQAYQADTAGYFADPTPQNLARLAIKYPEQAEALKQSYSIMAPAMKESRVGVLSSIYHAAKNGRADLVSAQIDDVIAAEKKAGIDTKDAEDLKAGLASGDKDALINAQAFAQMHLAAADPEFAKAAGIGGAKDDTHVINPGGALVDNQGNELYRAAEKPEYKTIKNADGTESLVAVGGNTPASAPSRGISGSDIETAALAAFPGTTVTSRSRTPEHNAEVGGAPNSRHLTDQARDFVPPKGVSMAQFASTLKKQIPGAKIINEGDHVHVQAGGSATASSGPQVVFTSTPGSGNPVDDATVEFYAQKIAAGGDLPTLGSGKEASAWRRAILTKAAAIQTGNGVSGGDSNLAQADVKANRSALLQAQKQYTSTVGFEDTFQRNVTEVLRLAPSGVAGGVPAFNRWIQAGRKSLQGDPAVSAFNVAVNTAANEYAKLASGASGGAVTSDSARHEAMEILNNAQTLPQLQASIKQMQIDGHNRVVALDTQIKRLRGNISGAGKSATASVQPPKPGQVVKGFRFKGGNPADRNSWVKAGG